MDKAPAARRLWSPIDAWVLLALIPIALVMIWSAGVFDSEILAKTRTSSVYVEPGAEVDERRAAEIVGDRKLVLVYLSTELGDRGRDICADLAGDLEGNLVVIVDEELDTYGCALLPGRDNGNFGKAFVAESVIARGLSSLLDDPTDSAKVMAATYDTMVRAGIWPEGARLLQAPAAAYVSAGALLGTVAVAAIGVNLAGRRLAVEADEARARRRRDAGAFARRDSALAALGARIIELDRRYTAEAQEVMPPESSARDSAARDSANQEATAQDRLLGNRFEVILRDYLDLCHRCESDSPDEEVASQTAEIEELQQRVDDLIERL